MPCSDPQTSVAGVQWVLSYMVASALLGLAVTYYYDDPANERLNTILKHGLQLAGLALVALSSAAPEVSAAAALGLVAIRLGRLPRCAPPPMHPSTAPVPPSGCAYGFYRLIPGYVVLNPHGGNSTNSCCLAEHGSYISSCRRREARC